MGLFTPNYSRPGPGVRADEPRKKGFARWCEILGRDIWPFFKAGFLSFVGIIPFIFFMSIAITSHAVLFMLLGGLLGGMIAGPSIVGMADTILRSLRDEPGYWWETYRRAWKRNWKSSIGPGAVCGLAASLQLFTLFHLDALGGGTGASVMLLVSIVLGLGLFNNIFAQLALLDLGFGGILKNSALLLLGFLPRCMGAAAVQLVYWGAVVLLFPSSLLLLIFTNFWLPMSVSLLIVYPALEKSFNIEATIKKMRDSQLEPTPIPTAAPAPAADEAAQAAPQAPAKDDEE